MYKEQDKQTTFFGCMIYDRIVPKEHFLRRLSETIDFSFVNKHTKDLYCFDNGRPCWEPQVIFKMLLLQYLYDLSDDSIEQECLYRLDFKYFLGIDASEAPPDSTTLVRFRDRLGAERFSEIFNHIVSLARKKNLVSDKLHIVDATCIRAKVDTWRLKQAYKRDDDQNYIDNHSPDKDARFGHKSPKETVYGYKGYICMDKENEIIVSETISPANSQEANHLPVLVNDESPPKQICGDRAYDTSQNNEYLKKKNIDSLILRKQPKTTKRLSGCFYNSARKQSRSTRERIKNIRSSIEHKIAELKRWHGLSICRFWGLLKSRIQHTMTCIAVNVKKMITLLTQGLAPP